MTLQIKVEDLLRLAALVNERAPGGCVDANPGYGEHKIRDRTGQVIGWMDLGMGYVHWANAEVHDDRAGYRDGA